LRESCAAIRDGPQKNEKRANLALFLLQDFRLNTGIVF